MIKWNKKRKVGLPPGTPIYISERPPIDTKITMIEFNAKDYVSKQLILEKIDINPRFEKSIRWIQVIGLKNLDLITNLLTIFEIHPLVIEDIFVTSQRSKFEDYGKYIFTVLNHISHNDESDEIQNNQISLILGKDFVLSFEETQESLFLPMIDRLVAFKGKIKANPADYLFYSLIDFIIDSYFSVVDALDISIEQLEDPIFIDPKPAILQELYQLKRNANDFRKNVWPLRELINKIQREESDLISTNLHIYLRDLYDHIFRISDLIENQRDIIFGLFDLYLSSISNKMNDIMKVLTIISTIFIPLSFIAGFYGMNFVYMPELKWKPAYPILIGVMIIIAGWMIYYFKRKKFFSK